MCWTGLLALLIVLSGCGEPLSNEEAPLLVEEVNRQIESVGDMTPPPEQDVGDLQVYVDRSVGMRPYTLGGASVYFDLLETLDGQLAGQVDFHGFGYPSQEQGQVVEPVDALFMEDPAAYTWVNNDYESLFADLDPDQPHLIISDGVQSEPEEGARFGGIVNSIGAWLETGGVFTLLAYRGPYEGTYYHEVPDTGAISYSCSDRPFYGFGFFPSVAAKQEYIEILEANGVETVHQITIGTSSASVVPREHSHPANEDQRRGERLFRSLTDHRNTHPDVGHVFSGQVANPDASAGSPLQFDVSVDSTTLPWRTLSGTDRERVMNALEPTFQHWRIDTLSVGNRQVALTETNAPRTFDTRATVRDTWHAHVDALLSHSPQQRKERIASVVQIGLGPTGANRLIPNDLSVRRDAAASACSQTLNIQPTMGAVIREHYVLGEALLVTEWR
ncbi:hypothetical protein CRI93_05665 [Longimonas halophila]|uniref:Uncharacterized protein n=1 Tax=Longimonas halophila TaxID=1469170 RepID=A0A2H3P6H2_9BACT|nr:hypothetical protein [Longimonas halophila]PEN07932.1 hypothetical protein CRI93_05665 [Longimonas halophila]